MEPSIQYAQTSDGVNIAYMTMGEGPPLVHMPWPTFGHLQLEMGLRRYEEWYRSLAEGHTLVRYDRRGTGMSDRDVTDHSLEAQVADLDAVVRRLGLDRFALLGLHWLAPAAIAYAAQKPEAVSHLVLWCGLVRGSQFGLSPRIERMMDQMESDWDFFTKTFVLQILGWEEPEAPQVAALIQESLSPEVWRQGVDAYRQYDVADRLAAVQAPTLVVHRDAAPALDLSSARELTSGIPDARLAVLEGNLPPWRGDVEAALRLIDDFLNDGESMPSQPAPASATGLVTILFTDMEASTALTQRLGDAKAQELVRAHNAIVREALKSNGGSEIKHTGDGIMASFPTASGALECAVAIQRAVDESDVGAHGHAPLRVRIGLNAGEPVVEDDDLFGTAVQLAARVCDSAEAGEIFASNVVRELAAGKGFLFADRGDAALRGFEDPVRLYEVRWREA
ncbi:MAG: alpha/beta fold hydrolase [Chloroflexi bacterium]|nr:alpha/beta fold hydrolase [Chloroflexota bacterium]